jgi:hypothetical protein
MVLRVQGEVRYARPKDNSHIVPHYQMCRVLPEKHIAHCAIGSLLQFQGQFVFDLREEKQVVLVVQRFPNAVS